MSTTDHPWGDEGFGATDDGFMKVPSKSRASSEQPPVPDTPEESKDHEAVESERIRIEPISALPPIAPPPTAPRKGRSLLWISLLALAVLVLAVVGIEWYISSRSLEDQAFRGEDVAVPQQSISQDQTEPALLDTSLAEVDTTRVDVADTESMPVRPQQPQQSVQSAQQSGTREAAATTPTTAPSVETRNEPTSRPQKAITTQPPPKNAAGPAWVVQVFASPSRDDAEEWLQQLREQRITDGYIVEQKVKGQSWYRVRFGQFASRSEAEAAALNRGFAQPWIARVR